MSEVSEVSDALEDFRTVGKVVERLVKKYNPLLSVVRWQLGLPADEDGVDANGKLKSTSYQTRVASLLMENQTHYFASLDSGAFEWIEKKIPNFEEILLKEIGAAVYRSVTVEIFSWQPMQGPVSSAAYYRQQSVSEPCVVKMAGQLDAIPEVRLEVAVDRFELQDEGLQPYTDAMVAKSAETAAIISTKAIDEIISAHGQMAAEDLVHMLVEEVFTNFERQSIAKLFEDGQLVRKEWWPNIDGSDDEFHTSMSRIAYLIHKSTGRAPGNCLIVGPEVLVKLKQSPNWTERSDTGLPVRSNFRLHKVGFYANKWRVYMDPVLAGRRVVMIYAGPSILDTGAIMAPYVISGALVANEASPHQAEGRFRLRGTTKVVSNRFLQVFEC